MMVITHKSLSVFLGIVVGVMVVAGSCRSPEPTAMTFGMPDSPEGGRLFKQHCAACHGSEGRGNGPAAIALEVRPRDFRNEPFRYVSTLESVPTQADLVQSIRSGRRIGEMPSHPHLTDAEIRTLADYVREINRLGLVDQLLQETAEEDEELTREEIEEIAVERVTPSGAIAVTGPGPAFRPDTEVGRKLYLANCASCHGPAGRGDGLDMPVDEQGKVITVRDLTAGKFRGGGEPEEIFKRIVCGIPGTPMPVQESMTDEEVWQVVHYVKFLAGRRR